MRVTITKSQRIADMKSCFCNIAGNRQGWLDFFRALPLRFYHSEGEWQYHWEVPQSKLQDILDKASTFQEEVVVSIPDYTDESTRELPEGFEFKTQPFAHQLDGFFFGLNHECFLLGDEQGLGKTKQILDIACALKAQGKIKHALIVCCDNAVKWNWVEEVKTHTNEDSFVLGTRYKKRSKDSYVGGNEDRYWDLCHLEDIPQFFLITNVETLRFVKRVPMGKPKKDGSRRLVKRYIIADKLNELASNGGIGLIAVDEIHKAKNPNSNQGSALLRIENGRRIPMTGTPILNAATDCYVPLKFMGLVKDTQSGFVSRYTTKDWLGNINGWRNLDELHSIISGNMLRRLKKDVLDLPPKLHKVHYVEMSKEQQAVYDDVYRQIKEKIDLVRVAKNPLAEMIRLRQATGWTGILSSEIQCSAKLDRLEELVEEQVSSGSKCIVFSNWTSVTQPILQRLSRFNPAYITGEVDSARRIQEVNRFQQDPGCKVCIGTISAMGVGLTLTAATNVLFMDEPWNRGVKEQCEDRAHRIGTTGTVNIGTLITKGTIDERIHQLITDKGELADLLVDGIIPEGRKEKLVDFLLS